METNESHLIFAFDIKADKPVIPLVATDLSTPTEQGSWRWVHLDRTHDATPSTLAETFKLPELAVQALLADETRPRVVQIGNGVVATLRAANFNDDSQPEETVSLRLWVDENRIISVRRQRVFSVQEIQQEMLDGVGPATIGEFLVSLTNKLLSKISSVVLDIEDELNVLEETELLSPTAKDQSELISIRRKSIPLKRTLAPQREALSQLAALRVSWLSQSEAASLREVWDHSVRILDSLDAIRDQASLLHEEMHNRISERTNRNSYILTIVAAIFLPLGLLTGMFGVNVGGVPWVENFNGFWLLTIFMLVVGVIQFAILKWLKWI